MKSFKDRAFIFVFGANTRGGKLFDFILLWAIVLSVVVVMLDSVPAISKKYHRVLLYVEWTFTIFFTLEYFLRLWAAKRPLSYALSFFGIIDLISTIPTYLTLIFPAGHAIMTIRLLRLLRVFRLLKLVKFLREAQEIGEALKASRYKITVFLIGVLGVVTIMGTIMYMVEGEQHGFDSIPRSIYWAIVTLTTVGYGDIYPHTTLGQFISAMIMILGYAIIAVPTGIVTAEFATEKLKKSKIVCPDCKYEKNPRDATYCGNCGKEIRRPLQT